MSEPAGRAGTGAPESVAEDQPAPTRDLADVFGDVLPDQTVDETAGGDDRRADEDDRDDELRRDVPPHY